MQRGKKRRWMRKTCPWGERQYGLRENSLGSGGPGFGSSITNLMTLKCSQLPHQLNWTNNLEAIKEGCNEV